MIFDTHINELSKKKKIYIYIYIILIYISRVSINVDKATRKFVVQALVLSLINYCIRIWGTTNNSVIKTKVHELQNFAAKFSICGMKNI